MNTSTTMAPTPIIERPHISWETWNFMAQKIAELEAANTELQADVTFWEQQTNTWYMKATYTDLERQIMYRRRSRGANEITGEWASTAQQSAVA